MDFKGNTSSAVEKPPTLEGVAGILSGTLEVFSSVVVFFYGLLSRGSNTEVTEFI